MSVCFEYCVLSCLGLFVCLITCTGESYKYVSVVIFVCCQVEINATG